MLIDRDRFDDVYEAIKLRAVSAPDDCSVLVLAAPDCDALCACRIITYLLRNDNVAFKVQPVSGYGEIADLAAQLPDSVSTVIMLNCGGGVDLTVLFASCDAQVFVVDNHRPIHLRNVHCAAERVVVLNADHTDDVPSDGEDLDGELSSDDESEDLSESDEESENDENADVNVPRRERNDDDDESAVVPRRKRRRRDKGEAEADESRRRKLAVRAYYDGTFDSTPSVLLLFSMCERLYRVGPTECWLASLGLTSMHTERRVDDAQYDGFVAYLADKLRQFDASSSSSSSTSSSSSSRGVAHEAAVVEFEPEEFRFMLHRHWSLFDAMYYSNYVAARLSVWKHDGRRRLQELLAKIGLSLEHCRQKYAFLAQHQQRAMRARLKQYGPQYKLGDPFIACFTRTSHHCGVTLSAADAAMLVDAALEEPQQRQQQQQPVADLAAVGEDAAVDPKAWTAGFWDAYDALLPDDGPRVSAGIQQACALQRAVVEHAVSMIERRAITCLKHFRYAYVAANSLAAESFVHPRAMRKLALFITRVHRDSGKWQPQDRRPLIILAEKNPGDTFLVVGIATHANARRQRLGQHFRLAADHIKAEFKQDWFDSAVIELEKENVQRFVESLHYVLSQ